MIKLLLPIDNFQDQMKRELSYREEMVQQLQIVRGEGLIHQKHFDSHAKFFPKYFTAQTQK